MSPTKATKDEDTSAPAMTELRYYNSDSAVLANAAQQYSAQRGSPAREKSASPFKWIRFRPRKQRNPPVDVLDSLNSLCSVISALTVPDTVACNKRQSHVRFQNNSSHSCQETVMQSLPPRIPTRQGSRTSCAAYDSSPMLPPSPAATVGDASPRKPERKVKETSVVKAIRKAIGSTRGSRKSCSDDQESTTSLSYCDSSPTSPMRRGSFASSA